MNKIFAKVEGMNTSDGMINLAVVLENQDKMNIKVSSEFSKTLELNTVYQFDVYSKETPERVSYYSNTVVALETLDFKVQDEVLRKFFETSPIALDEAINTVNSYIDRIDNTNIKKIVKFIIEKNKDLFYTYPAAAKLHHAYLGGLAQHTIGMLDLVDGFLKTYPYLNKDYIYAGVILHDIGKVKEFSGVQNTGYVLEGQLLGHLVIGMAEIEDAVKNLNLVGSEEVLLLEHMVISHHGQPQFGACKKPMTAEALLLWYIDTLDSKFRVLGEYLDNTESGEFTDQIGVLDRMKFYKPKNN